MAAQVDTGGFVRAAAGGKALALKRIDVAVECEIGQRRGQRIGVGFRVHGGPLQRQAGRVGQAVLRKVFRRLGQVDANAAQNRPRAARLGALAALAQNAHDLFAVQQQVVGPFDLAVRAVLPPQRRRHSQAGIQRQRAGVGQRQPQHGRIVQRLPGGVGPGAAQPPAPGCLVCRVHRAHRAEPVKVRFGPGVGAVRRGQADQCVQPAHSCGTRFQPKLQRPSSTSITP